MSTMNEADGTAGSEDQDSPNQRLLEQHCEEILDELARAARKTLRARPVAGGDEHDIALSVMRTFIRRDKALKIANLQESKDLLHLLLWLTARKVADKRRQQLRPKHGGGHVLGSDALALNEGRLKKKPAEVSRRRKAAGTSSPTSDSSSEPLVDSDLTGELNAECLRLLDLLDSEHREVALLKLQGYSNEDIKQKVGWSKAWVERRLHNIRECWRTEQD